MYVGWVSTWTVERHFFSFVISNRNILDLLDICKEAIACAITILECTGTAVRCQTSMLLPHVEVAEVVFADCDQN